MFFYDGQGGNVSQVRDKIDKLRLKHGIKTYRELAKRLGVSYDAINRWIVNDKIPDRWLFIDDILDKSGNNTAYGDPLLDEFIELYGEHKTPKIELGLLELITRLKKIKAQEEEL